MSKKRGKKNAPASRQARAPSVAARSTARPSVAIASMLELVHDESEISERPLMVVAATPPPPRLVLAPTPTPTPARALPAIEAPVSPTLISFRGEPESPREPESPEENVTIPPVVEDVHGFFAEGDRASQINLQEAARVAQEAVEEQAERDRRFGPAVRARRARFVQTVRVLVAVAAVLSVVAFGRGIVERADQIRNVAASQFQRVQPLAPEAQQAEVTTPKVEVKLTAAASPPATLGTATAAPSASATTAASERTAKEEKVIARKLLERGKLPDSIAAAERSIAIDPTDAETWLLLGSAQQDLGKWAEAQKTYRACVKQAKGAHFYECQTLIH